MGIKQGAIKRKLKVKIQYWKKKVEEGMLQEQGKFKKKGKKKRVLANKWDFLEEKVDSSNWHFPTP